MTNQVGNWISETCTTVGTGPLTLTGPINPTHLSFALVVPAGTVYYSIVDGVNQEAGTGTFDGVGTLTRIPTATKVNQVFDGSSPVPITLSGNAVVSCTLNAVALNLILDYIAAGDSTAQDVIDAAASAAAALVSETNAAASEATVIALANTLSNYPVDVFSGNSSTVAFALSQDPIFDSALDITISGIVQDVSTYSQAGQILTFTVAPPTGTNNIQVVYRGASFSTGSNLNSISDVNIGVPGIAQDTYVLSFDDATKTFILVPNTGGGGTNDHFALLNIGTNTHVQLDAHLANTGIHFTEASIDHANIIGIGTNSHTAIDLHVADGTIHFTKGSILINDLNDVNVGTPGAGDNAKSIIWDNATSKFVLSAVPSITDHTQLSNIGTNTHAQLDAHLVDVVPHRIINDTSIVTTELFSASEIITRLGTKEDANVNIQAHIADGTRHFLETNIDHVNIQNVGTNLHAAIDTHIAGSALQHASSVITYDNAISGLTATNVKTAIDENNTNVKGRMNWLNLWVDGPTYVNNDTVKDGDWTMVANKSTTERAAPQPIGAIDTQPPVSTVFTTANFTGVVKMVHEYTSTLPGWFKSLRIRTAAWDLDVVTKITVINVTAGTAKIFDNPILTDNDWTTLTLGEDPYASGTVFRLEYEYYNSTAASNVSGQWRSDVNTGVPASAEFTIDNATTPTVMEVHHTDIAGASSRQAELDGIVVNSIIDISEAGSPNRSIQLKVTAVDTAAANSTQYSVSVISNGSNDVRNNRDCLISIDPAITAPSVYNLNTNFWATDPVWATVTSKLYYDGVLQADLDDAYGIEVAFQEGLVSADWDVLALSGGGGAGGGGGSTVIVRDDLTGNGAITEALSANQGYILDQNAIAHAAGTATQHNADKILFDDTIVNQGFTQVQETIDYLDVQTGLRETATTGLISGGVVTLNTSTTIDVSLGDSEIINGYTDRRNPTVTNVTWTAFSNITVTMPDAFGSQVFYIDNLGALQQSSTALTPQQRRNVVQLAFVSYKAGAITNIQLAGINSNEVGNTLYDFMNFLAKSDRANGLGINAVTGQLQIFGDSGEFLSPGINIATDLTDLNILSLAAIGSTSVAAPFDILFADGTVHLAAQTTIPQLWESAPGVASASAGAGIIHYIYRSVDNKLFLQLATRQYPDAKFARDSLETDRTSYSAFTGSGSTLLSAQVYLDTPADFNDPSLAGIVSLIGSGANSGGGVAVTDYLSLTDVTSTTFVGQAGKVSTVNGGETGLEFTTVALIDTGLVQTTNATQATLHTIPIPTNQERILSVKVIGNEIATGDTVWRTLKLCAKNIAGTVSMVGGVSSSSGNDAGAVNWDITASISTTNIIIQVTGEAAKTIDWNSTSEVN